MRKIAILESQRPQPLLKYADLYDRKDAEVIRKQDRRILSILTVFKQQGNYLTQENETSSQCFNEKVKFK